MDRLFCAIATAVVLTMLLSAVAPQPAVASQPTVLTEGQVRQVVTGYLKEKTEHLGIEIRLKETGFSGEVVLPPGDVSYDVVAPQDWEGWGRGAVALIVRVNGQVVKNIPLNVYVEALSDMVVTTRALERGTVVDKSDVAVQKRDLATSPTRACRTLDEAVGMKVRVGMRGNMPVRSDYLERAPIVKSGQMVTIVAENSAFRATATGIARGSGAAGDTVMVQNLGAQKYVPAVVVDANTVKVGF